jgi:pimeloyl-ACP methyl ester carboxylesterase
MAGSARSGRRTAAVATLALLVGALLVSLGVGVGLPHLAKAGWSPLTVLGLAALVAGVALAVAGLVGLVRAVGGWWRLPVAVGAGLATLLVVYLVAIPVAATVVPPTTGDGRTPASVGLTFREVRLPTTGGDLLAGWYVPSRNGAAVALLHGSGSTRSSTLDHAVVLARRGYGVLLLDARGHGDSTGRAMDFGWHGDSDVRAATAYLSSPEAGVEPGRVAAVGLSMGGEQALGALEADPRLAAVVAEGATGRVAADLDWLSTRYGWRGQVQEWLDAGQTGLAAVLSGLRPPRTLAEGLSGSTAPVLLVTAGQRPDEGYAAGSLRATAPDRVEVWPVPGSDHVGGLATAPAEWERRVVGFLDRALQPVE